MTSQWFEMVREGVSKDLVASTSDGRVFCVPVPTLCWVVPLCPVRPIIPWDLRPSTDFLNAGSEAQARQPSRPALTVLFQSSPACLLSAVQHMQHQC